MTHSTYVQAMKNTGVYVAKLVEKQEDRHQALVEVLAVIKHPRQGDLHKPKQVDVPYFHPRKALAKHEKTWVPLATLKQHEGDIPDYQTSLQKAYKEKIAKLEADDSDWARASLQRLKEYETEYGL